MDIGCHCGSQTVELAPSCADVIVNVIGCHRTRIPIKTSTYMHYVNFGSEYVSWGGVGQPGVPAPWNCKSSRDVTLHFTVPGGRNPRWPPPHDTMSEKQNECTFFSSRGRNPPPAGRHPLTTRCLRNKTNVTAKMSVWTQKESWWPHLASVTDGTCPVECSRNWTVDPNTASGTKRWANWNTVSKVSCVLCALNMCCVCHVFSKDVDDYVDDVDDVDSV